jgi:putative CocE/NonD family hydrolase
MFYAYDRLPQEIKKKSRFVIGPWNHGLGNCVDAYPLPDSEKAGAEAFCETLRWMDGCFKGYPVPALGLDAYIIGRGIWKTFPRWPSGSCRRYYLCSDENGRGGSGSLKTEPSIAGKKEYEYDPARPPVEAIGAESMMTAPPEKRGSRLQPPPAFRDDVLSFLSDPLEDDLEICGRTKVKLLVSSSAADTAFAVKLMELFPNGDAYNIRSGISSIGYRNDAPKREPYTPGESIELNIVLWPITWRIHKNSRLRLDLMSTLFPEFHIHSNTDKQWAEAEKVQIARQTVFTGEVSELLIPLAGSL